ncbi:MAG: hypothetical protein K1W34_04660 [Lachnospiraceae bacterium]
MHRKQYSISTDREFSNAQNIPKIFPPHTACRAVAGISPVWGLTRRKIYSIKNESGTLLMKVKSIVYADLGVKAFLNILVRVDN